jgi:hypothetical protein
MIANCRLPIADLFRLAIGNWKSAMKLVSSVWQHRYDALMVRLGDKHINVQLTLSLVGLFRQYVPRMRMATLDLSRSRQPESLGCTFMCFQFWHC